MIKNIILTALLLTTGMLCKAQKTKAVQPKKIFFTSYVGLAKTDAGTQIAKSNGFQAMTGIEYKIKGNSAIYGEINFDSYKYSKQTPFYSINGNISTIPITVGFKQYFLKSKIKPYFKLGVGLANITKPEVTYIAGFTSINNQSKIVTQYQTNAGINYSFKPDYRIFVEVGYQHFSNNNLLNQTYSNKALRVGLSTAL